MILSLQKKQVIQKLFINKDPDYVLPPGTKELSRQDLQRWGYSNYFESWLENGAGNDMLIDLRLKWSTSNPWAVQVYTVDEEDGDNPLASNLQVFDARIEALLGRPDVKTASGSFNTAGKLPPIVVFGDEKEKEIADFLGPPWNENDWKANLKNKEVIVRRSVFGTPWRTSLFNSAPGHLGLLKVPSPCAEPCWRCGSRRKPRC